MIRRRRRRRRGRRRRRRRWGLLLSLSISVNHCWYLLILFSQHCRGAPWSVQLRKMAKPVEERSVLGHFIGWPRRHRAINVTAERGTWKKWSLTILLNSWSSWYQIICISLVHRYIFQSSPVAGHHTPRWCRQSSAKIAAAPWTCAPSCWPRRHQVIKLWKEILEDHQFSWFSKMLDVKKG